jgi:hypothetical protein
MTFPAAYRVRARIGKRIILGTTRARLLSGDDQRRSDAEPRTGLPGTVCG